MTTDDHNDDYIGDDDHAGGDVDDGDGCMEFTSALFDKSNSARDVREERGPEVVFLNFWGFNQTSEVVSYPQCHLSAALKACSS